jgi:hypothetical protein
MTSETDQIEPEPRWLPLIAVLAVSGLYIALPRDLTFGPRLAIPVIVVVLLVPIMIAHQSGWHWLDHLLGIALSVVLTISMIVSVGLLIQALLAGAESGAELLRSAASLWATNILVFALWYWRLDAGGPHVRDLRAHHTSGAFLFPQMVAPKTVIPARWSPRFVDYLFLAFNTSTAFSPTDTPVLTRWGKLLMMLESTISLAVLLILAARAVNIIRP